MPEADDNRQRGHQVSSRGPKFVKKQRGDSSWVKQRGLVANRAGSEVNNQVRNRPLATFAAGQQAPINGNRPSRRQPRLVAARIEIKKELADHLALFQDLEQACIFVPAIKLADLAVVGIP